MVREVLADVWVVDERGDPEGAQVEGDIARCICDPVTLGGAFGLHAVRL